MLAALARALVDDRAVMKPSDSRVRFN